MGIRLPPPPAVELNETEKKKERSKVDPTRTDSFGPEKPQKRTSILGPSVTPESRTVYANSLVANTSFKYQVMPSVVGF